jgi:hypothetical protein
MGDDSGRQDPRLAGQIVSLEGEAGAKVAWVS